MSDLQTQGHELKCGRHSAMQVKKAKLRDLLGDFLGDALVLSRFTIVMYVLLLCFFWFGMAVWVSSAVVFFCCLWRPCGPALLLCFFFVWGGLVGQLCCCVFLLFGGALWASSAVVFFLCLGRPCGPALLLLLLSLLSLLCFYPCDFDQCHCYGYVL